MYAKYHNIKQYHHVHVHRELKMDCFMWQEFLAVQDNVARPFVDFDSQTHSEDITLTSDASLNHKLGFAGYFRRSDVNDG